MCPAKAQIKMLWSILDNLRTFDDLLVFLGTYEILSRHSYCLKITDINPFSNDACKMFWYSWFTAFLANWSEYFRHSANLKQHKSLKTEILKIWNHKKLIYSYSKPTTFLQKRKFSNKISHKIVSGLFCLFLKFWIYFSFIK